MSGARDGEFELITLRSGKRAVRHLGHGEVMHPSVGPWEEANRLYVDQVELERHLHKEEPTPLRILDVGLGAATNAVAVLTKLRALELAGDSSRRRPLELTSLEIDLAPLRLAVADVEGFPFLAPFASALHELMETGEHISPGLHWKLLLGDARSLLGEVRHLQELVLFDPFSPKANPSLWTPAFLARIRQVCREDGEGALVATYSAATPTRISFLLGGFFVGAGASTGQKGETTLAATKLSSLAHPLGRRFLERWERSSSRAPHGTELTAELEARIRSHPQFDLPAAR